MLIVTVRCGAACVRCGVGVALCRFWHDGFGVDFGGAVAIGVDVVAAFGVGIRVGADVDDTLGIGMSLALVLTAASVLLLVSVLPMLLSVVHQRQCFCQGRCFGISDISCRN